MKRVRKRVISKNAAVILIAAFVLGLPGCNNTAGQGNIDMTFSEYEDLLPETGTEQAETESKTESTNIETEPPEEDCTDNSAECNQPEPEAEENYEEDYEYDESIYAVLSEAWYIAAGEFLSEYLSLFSPQILEAWYNAFFRDNSVDDKGGFPDPVSGSMIYAGEVPYIRSHFMWVWNFFLYDLDDDGIPEIVISLVTPETCHSSMELYRYVDGEYRELKTPYIAFSFYTDKHENIVLYYHGEMDGYYRCYYVTITDSKLELDVIAGIVDGNFYNHITNTQLDLDIFREAYDNNTLPGMPDEPLKKIEPLTSLQRFMTESITQELIESGKILEP